MTKKAIHFGILGGQLSGLDILSELHQHDDIVIDFVYDRSLEAVGVEIAEILGINRCHRPRDLPLSPPPDYVVLGGPQERFAEEVRSLRQAGAKILSPSAALKIARNREEIPLIGTPPRLALPEPERYSVSDALSAIERVFDRSDLLEFLLEVAVKASGATTGSIMLYSAEADELYIAYANGLSERVVKTTRQKLGEGIAGMVGASREPRLVHLPDDAPRYGKARDRVDIGSAIAVPLIWEDRLLGVLNVSSMRSDHELDSDDLDRLKSFSARISRVLFESNKLRRAQIRQRESSFRKSIGEVSGRDLSTQEKLTFLTSYLTDITGADTVEIFVSTHEGEWFVLGGSNRWLTPIGERIRVRRGVLGRAFLEKRCLVLTERGQPDADSDEPAVSSAAYCYLALNDTSGIAVVEFSDRECLEEFMLVRDAILGELSQFLASEMRERSLRRKVEKLGKVNAAIASIVGCQSVADLAETLARVVADTLECQRVSVRLREKPGEAKMVLSLVTPPDVETPGWPEEDARRYEQLADKRSVFSMDFLDFEPGVKRQTREIRSMMAFPLVVQNEFFGGIIAYDKSPEDPMEEAVFSDMDRTILDDICGMIWPIIQSLHGERVIQLVEVTPQTPASAFEANRERLRTFCETEIARSERYHHTFALIIFRIRPIQRLHESREEQANELMTTIAQGIRKRIRKTDYGCWIEPGMFGLLSLEGGKRVRFLISRVILYLVKNVKKIRELSVGKSDVEIGSATYPGAANSVDELFDESERSLRPAESE